MQLSCFVSAYNFVSYARNKMKYMDNMLEYTFIMDLVDLSMYQI